jgi:hypothetical protein
MLGYVLDDNTRPTITPVITNFEEITLVRDKTHLIFNDDIPDRIPCNNCGLEYTKDQFGINKKNNTVYKNCEKCRDKMSEYDTQKRNCEESDDTEESVDTEESTDDEESIVCNECNKNFIKTFYQNGKKAHKNCLSCREKRKKHDKKKNEKHHDKILQNKKEYYEKNKETIRAKQKEYYDNNSSEIIEHKKIIRINNNHLETKRSSPLHK